MKALFLSYSSTDRTFARRLTGDLERANHRVWLDERDITVGINLTAIESAISDVDFLVVVLSHASAGSEWVRREVEIARNLDIRVLPVLVDDSHAWPAYLRQLAHADFRSARGYRRSLQRLVAAIDEVDFAGRFMSAKQAVAAVREKYSPAGDLFGVSQQGVALIYFRLNSRDWEWADAADGTSRFWITEFFEPAQNLIDSYALVDGAIHELPRRYMLDPAKPPEPGSVLTYSCGLNPKSETSPDRAETLIDENPEQFTHISKRLVPYLPIPLLGSFVDSTEAISRATDTAHTMHRIRRHDDVITLATLECDKTNHQLPTWRVSFFDPSVAESVLTVGINPATGDVRARAMHAETLNANLMPIRTNSDGNHVIGAKSQFRAISARNWDIPKDLTDPQWQLTAREAMTMAAASVDGDNRWQIGFLSNTGLPRVVTSPDIRNSNEGLLKRTGLAGQWVVDLLSITSRPVSEGSRKGTSYDWKQFVCTRKSGPVDVTHSDRLILTSVLTPVTPGAFIDGYERARRLVLASVSADYLHMSVASTRPQGGLEWFFRFYNDRDIIARMTISADGRRVLNDFTA